MYKNMTCRQSRFYTLDMTGFSLRFINLLSFHDLSLSQKFCTLYVSMVAFKSKCQRKPPKMTQNLECAMSRILIKLCKFEVLG